MVAWTTYTCYTQGGNTLSREDGTQYPWTGPGYVIDRDTYCAQWAPALPGIPARVLPCP